MRSNQDVLALCRDAGRTGNYSISETAHVRVTSKQLATEITHVLANATECTWDGARYLVRGVSLDGQETTISVVVHGGILSVQ